MYGVNASFDVLVRKSLARHLQVDPECIEPSHRLDEDLGLAPLDLVLIALRFEEDEIFEFPMERLHTGGTVAELTKVLREWTQEIDFDVPLLTGNRAVPDYGRQMRRAS